MQINPENWRSETTPADAVGAKERAGGFSMTPERKFAVSGSPPRRAAGREFVHRLQTKLRVTEAALEIYVALLLVELMEIARERELDDSERSALVDIATMRRPIEKYHALHAWLRRNFGDEIALPSTDRGPSIPNSR